MGASWRRWSGRGLSIALCLFVVAEVNYPVLRPQTELALFVLLGLGLALLGERAGPGPTTRRRAALDLGLFAMLFLACAWVIVQTEPLFERLWVGGASLGDRAGAEGTLDLWLGGLGLVVVLVVTRRTVGWALPLLAGAFLLYAFAGPRLPSWLFPHRGYSLERVVSQTFLHSQGVFGIAIDVMFTYVFLFVVLGALLEATGATRFIIDGAQRLLAGTVGGPAKVSVLSSGLMGSLSGSAVANTATTGTFTIPLMHGSGFARHVAAGVEAAASSGGALVPPVMGAGAYMMLEIVTPPVTYVEIIRAALIPAVLYYLSLFLMVHFYAARIGARADSAGASGERRAAPREPLAPMSGVVFVASLAALLVLLLAGFTVFRSVSVAMLVALLVSALDRRTRLGWAELAKTVERAARSAVALVAAAASVGIVIGVVTLTGVGTKLPSLILPMAQDNLTGALVLIMVSSIVLGMGLPSAVCYLLMATLIGPVLGKLGVVPLAAHLFIFYFGMMSMVTPPVALAAYTAASIARAGIMRSGLTAFRFALVGFTLPYLFVFRPQLLLLDAEGELAPLGAVVVAVVVAVAGIVPLAGAVAGYLGRALRGWERGVLGGCAALLLFPAGAHHLGGIGTVSWINIGGALLLAGMLVWTRSTRFSERGEVERT